MYWAWWLHLDLLSDQRLEGLVALRLMILNRGTPERSTLAANRAWSKFTRLRVDGLIFCSGKLRPPTAQVHLPVPHPKLRRVEATRNQIVLGGLTEVAEHG